MAQSITLTASMRSNLSSLKSIQKQMNTTQERLSTGKKVNSAIDNATSYYQSRSLTNRASDLDALLDSMGQGIQTIQAANEGIEAATSFVEQLKSVAQTAHAAASGGADAATIKNYQDQYNAILKEVKTLVADSGYQGINLLDGGKLTVTFDEKRLHALEVQGDSLTGQLHERAANGFSWDETTGYGNIDWKGGIEPTLYKYDAYEMTKETVTVGTTDVSNFYTFDAGVWTQASGKAATGVNYYSKATTATVTYATAVPANTGTGDTGSWNVADGNGKIYYDDQGTTKASLINDTLDAISLGLDYLRDYTSELGNNYSIIQTRQNFTEALIDVLETGSDNLVLADMNEESANYLALQTRQQLAINSLSLASQSAQSVLKLF